MRAHLRYLSYVLRHKWFVLLECLRFGIPWLGIIHDWHKFAPREWFPYVHFFYSYKPDDTGDSLFDLAWFCHQKTARHHWQSWCFPGTNGDLKVLPIPRKYMLEMLADWYGAAQAQGLERDSVKEWYKVNRHKMLLHPEAQEFLELEIYGSVP